MKKRRVLGSTACRSDYDLLSGVYRALQCAPDIDFGLLVSGSHLSPTFGSTVTEVHRDGLRVVAEIETLIDANSTSSRLKTAAILLQNAIHTVNAFQPDVILAAGDREDVLVMMMLGAYLKIPTIHFFGGDHATDGNVDNPVRHACSKLATFHFVVHDQHALRLLRLGEEESRIHVIGSPQLDRLCDEPSLDLDEVLRIIGVPTSVRDKPLAVLVHHPILGYETVAVSEVRAIIEVLRDRGFFVLINSPNADAGCRDLIKCYEELRGEIDLWFFKNLPRNLFINLLRHSKLLIGNSSMGIFESASIPLPAINVGLRQRGRLAPQTVQFADGSTRAIGHAVDIALTPEFQFKTSTATNPYGDGRSVARAVEIIRSIDFSLALKKESDPLEIPLS